MKHVHKFGWLFAILFFCVNTTPVSAQTLKDVFNNSETQILYLGVDFTKAKVIGDPSATAGDVRDRHYPGINDLVITEFKKYDLKSAFHKSSVDHDLGLVAKRNEKINTEDIESTNSGDFHRLKSDDIEGLVKGFDFGGKKGIGLLFVMEGMNKPDKAAAMWVTLIDMSSHKMLMTERMEGKTSMSFGFRNFWATPIKNVIEEIEKKKYKEWKLKYGS
jgi:hypothetical protein